MLFTGQWDVLHLHSRCSRRWVIKDSGSGANQRGLGGGRGDSRGTVNRIIE
jgi:hypothetical protein